MRNEKNGSRGIMNIVDGPTFRMMRLRCVAERNLRNHAQRLPLKPQLHRRLLCRLPVPNPKDNAVLEADSPRSMTLKEFFGSQNRKLKKPRREKSAWLGLRLPVPRKL